MVVVRKADMSNAAQMVELLQALSSSENQKRHQAETMFQQAKASNADDLLLGFVSVLGEDSLDEAVRRQSAVLLRQMVSKGADKDFVFARLNPVNKQQVAAHLLSRFEAISNTNLQQKVGDVIAKLAETVSDDDQRGWLAPGQKGWPNLLATVFRLGDPTDASNSPATCEASIRLLKDLVGTYKDEITRAQQQLGAIVQGALAHTNPQIRCAAFVLVCELVGILDKKDWAPLMVTAGVLTSVLQQLAEANLQEALQECLQQYLEVASLEPDFFKQQLSQTMEPANLLAKFVKTRTGVEEGVRNMSLEWLVTYAEKKPKWLAKSLKNFAPLVLECCMELMLEVEAGDEELKEWIERMDDEEGEEDSDELYHNGEEAIDRVVEAMTMDVMGPTLFGLVGKYATQDVWQAKLAALTAVKQTVEYVEDTEHMNEMAKLLLMSMDHPHPRVRYTALHALGQLSNDQAPQFQDAWHSTVMPMLLVKMDDQIDRVASMAMSAFVSFGEELETALMAQYANGFMEKLVSRLQASKHRMVQEECVTSIAVIAGVIEKDFQQYYDAIMPLLKQLVFAATGEKESRLRGKAFECMSLLGLAVGKEKFLPDAQKAVEEMLKTSCQADDLQKEYLKEAFERICKCLKADFAPFLPHLLPGIYTSLKLEAEDANAVKQGTGGDDEEDEYITVSTGEGKLVKVRSSKFEEMVQSTQLLNTYCEELEGAFFDYVKPTAEALLPLLSASDEVSLLCDEARSAAFQTWASLIKCARTGAKDRGQPATIASELLRTFLQHSLNIMTKEQDAETLRDAADGLAACLKQCEPGSISGDEVRQLVEQLFKFVDDSFRRTVELEKEKKEGVVGAPQELQGDEDDEDNTLDEEDQCRRSLEDAIGSVMKAAPEQFVASQCLPACGAKIQQWLGTKEHRALALLLACDMLEHLKERSEPVWPAFMEQALNLLGDKDADVRIPAAYAISLAAPIPNFAAAAPEAFRRVAQLVSGPAPKKRDDSGKIAMDNCVSALASLMQHKSSACPPEVPAWQLIVNKLPLRDDEDEAKKVHKMICELVMSQNAGLLGPDNAHIGKILSALAEVYKQEELSAKETDALILRIFQMLPRSNLQQLAAGFSEKQQKKIEKMLTEGQVPNHGG